MNRIILILLAAAASLYATAQKVAIAEIKETRSTDDGFFMNSCDVRIKLSGDEMRKYTFAKVAAITKATDDQDIDMRKEENGEREYKELSLNTKVSIELKSSSRKATSIKELQGSIKLYHPTETNGAMFTINDFLSRPNVNLLPAGLPVKVLVMNPDSLKEATRKDAGKKDGQAKTQNAPDKALAEAFTQAFSGFFGMDNNPNQLSLYIDGDRSRLVDIKFQDQTGKPVNYTSRSSMSNKIIYRFRDKPEKGWKMTIYLESEASVTTIPFSFTNIDLP